MQGHFLWQWLYIDSLHNICSNSSWILSKLRRNFTTWRAQILILQKGKEDKCHLHIYNTGRQHTYTLHILRQQIPLPCQPCVILEEHWTLDELSRSLWEHGHRYHSTLKTCNVLQREKELACLWWLVSPLCSSQMTEFKLMIAPGNSWKEQGWEGSLFPSSDPQSPVIRLSTSTSRALLSYSCGSN